MTTTPLSEPVVSFLQSHISSLLQLEALLLVFDSGTVPRTVADVSAEMYVPCEAVEDWLAGFAADGFCSNDDRGYCAPRDVTTQELLSDVAEAYLRRPVSVGRLIFGSSRDDLASLSDAFRLRKER